MKTWLECIHVDYENGTALVLSNRTGKSFPVTVKKDIKYLISRKDRLQVTKSAVTGKWIAVDYAAMTAIATGDE